MQIPNKHEILRVLSGLNFVTILFPVFASRMGVALLHATPLHDWIAAAYLNLQYADQK